MFPKNEQKNSTQLLWYIKSNCFRLFFGRIEDANKTFQNSKTFTIQNCLISLLVPSFICRNLWMFVCLFVWLGKQILPGEGSTFRHDNSATLHQDYHLHTMRSYTIQECLLISFFVCSFISKIWFLCGCTSFSSNIMQKMPESLRIKKIFTCCYQKWISIL